MALRTVLLSWLTALHTVDVIAWHGITDQQCIDMCNSDFQGGNPRNACMYGCSADGATSTATWVRNGRQNQGNCVDFCDNPSADSDNGKTYYWNWSPTDTDSTRILYTTWASQWLVGSDLQGACVVGCEERGGFNTVVPCPENSVGDDVDAGCAVNEGYSGSVTATTTSPFFQEDITAVPCPENSAGDVPTGCTVNEGYSGSVTATTTSPFFEEDISAGVLAMPALVSVITVALVAFAGV